MDILTLIILSLATYRLTRLFYNEEGPFSICIRLRNLAGVVYDERSNRTTKNEMLDKDDKNRTSRVREEIAKTFNCPHCLGMWIAFAVWGGYFIPNAYLFYWLYTPLAISAINTLFFLRLGSD